MHSNYKDRYSAKIYADMNGYPGYVLNSQFNQFVPIEENGARGKPVSMTHVQTKTNLHEGASGGGGGMTFKPVGLNPRQPK